MPGLRIQGKTHVHNKHSSSYTSSGLSSISSNEVDNRWSTGQSDSGMDLSSITEQVFEDLSISECTSDTEESNNTNVTVNFTLSSPEDETLYELYKQVLDWLDVDCDVFTCTTTSRQSPPPSPASTTTLDIQSLAVVLFLQQQHFEHGQQYLSSRPWKYHHKEWIGSQVYSNSQHYYMLTMDRPLCSLRQIHCGKQYLRIVRYVSSKHWKDTISLYKLILNRDVSVFKRDVCVFNVGYFPSYDVQFALKRLPKGIIPKKTRKAQLCFQVCDIGSLVPLFPNTCHKVSDVRWCTKDLDGNRIYLKVNSSSSGHDVLLNSLPPRARSVSPSKFHAHSKHSAFSPVVPNKVKVNDGLIDKLSPRVFDTVSNRPPLPGKKQTTTKGRRNLVVTAAPPASIRTRPSSANAVVSDNISNIRAYPLQSSTLLTKRPSSANSVLISTEPQCSHSYTDSGFVDCYTDTKDLHHTPERNVRHTPEPRDPRRTPIIGGHVSNLTQYERYISAPSNDITNRSTDDTTFSSYHSDNVLALERQPYSQEYKPFTANQHPSRPTYTKDWVESYVEDQNKLLGIQPSTAFIDVNKAALSEECHDTTCNSYDRLYQPEQRPLSPSVCTSTFKQRPLSPEQYQQPGVSSSTLKQKILSPGPFKTISSEPSISSTSLKQRSQSPNLCHTAPPQLCKIDVPEPTNISNLPTKTVSSLSLTNPTAQVTEENKLETLTTVPSDAESSTPVPLSECSMTYKSVQSINMVRKSTGLTTDVNKADTTERSNADNVGMPQVLQSLNSESHVTSRSPVVDPEEHNLEEYMDLCWANSHHSSYKPDIPCYEEYSVDVDPSLAYSYKQQDKKDPLPPKYRQNSIDLPGSPSNGQSPGRLEEPIHSHSPHRLDNLGSLPHDQGNKLVDSNSSKLNTDVVDKSDCSKELINQYSGKSIVQDNVYSSTSTIKPCPEISTTNESEIQAKGHEGDNVEGENVEGDNVEGDNVIGKNIEKNLPVETDFTLGQFLDSNKTVSEFLERQGNTGNLPDVVQINDSCSKDIREGCPEDVTPLKSCLPDERKRVKRKKVTFSDVNSRHVYQALDWQSYNDHENQMDEINENLHEDEKPGLYNSVESTEDCGPHKNITQPMKSYTSKTLNDHSTSKVASIIAKFNTPISPTSEPQNNLIMESTGTVEKSWRTDTQNEAMTSQNHSNNIINEATYTSQDWNNIKEKADIGFYI